MSLKLHAQRSPSIARLKSCLAGMGTVELARRLVRAPSPIGLVRREEAVAGILARYLKSHGIRPALIKIAPGRPNLLATLKSSRPGRRLLLCGHTDTVAPNVGASANPFSGKIRGGRLFGRGAADMKGALAAMATALAVLKKLDALRAGSVTLAAVIDEEMASLGAEALIKSGFKADGAIVGEPTQNRVALGHKGLEWLEIEFQGKSTHGGTAASGINAISAAARFTRIVEEELVPRLKKRKHPLLGNPTINLGTIAGGDQPSTVAGRCTIQLDRRWIPGETVKQVFAELKTILAQVRAAQPGLRTCMRRVPGGMTTMVHGPLETSTDHPLAQAALEARRQARPVAFPAWTDAALLSREGGIPSIVLGPGDLALAHSPDESVPLAQVEEAAMLYILTALDFCI